MFCHLANLFPLGVSRNLPTFSSPRYACADCPGRTEAASSPYQVGGVKRWWLSQQDLSEPNNARLRAYVRALLTAAEHESDVHHFRSLEDYLRIVDPHELAVLQDKQQARRKRKYAALRAIAAVDDWDACEPAPKRQQRAAKRKAKPRPKSRPAIEAGLEPAQAITDENLDGEAAGWFPAAEAVVAADEVFEAPVDADADTVPRDVLLRELLASFEDSDAECEHEISSGNEPVGTAPASPAHLGSDRAGAEAQAAVEVDQPDNGDDSFSLSSSSTSSSSSSSSSSSTAPKPAGGKRAAAKSKAAAKPKQVSRTVAVVGTRDKTNRIEYGLHHLVPRYKDGSIFSYQMTCSLPQHNPSKQMRCTRELTVQLAGSPENARRVLKAWVLLGHSMPDRACHMDKSSRQQLLGALQDGTLFSEEELDRILAVTAESEIVAPFCENVGAKPAGRKLLGAAGAGVSKDVHKEMEALAVSGGVPVTTLSQRQRNKLSSGTKYGVPVGPLQRALQFGYIHPNLPPPTGYVWKYYGGSWMLGIRGG